MPPQSRNKPPPTFGWKQAAALFFWLAVLGVMVGLLFADAAAAALDVGYWWAVAAAALAVVVGLPVVFVAVFAALFLWQQRRLRSEAYEFARVRKVARSEGAVVRFGGVTAWVAEPDDHPPLLRQALEAARTRFATLLPGFGTEGTVPLRVVCFEAKRDLETYGRRLGLPLESLEGVYLQRRPRRILAVAEVVPRRPVDPAPTLRSLFAHSVLEQAKGFLLPPWLGQAITDVIARTGDRGELGRLNRKVLASLARAGPPDEGRLFHVTGWQLVGWLRRGRAFEAHAEVARFLAFARSVGEYLAGGLATADRLTRFRAFVTELGRSDAPERVFERHFGYGFRQLLQDWRGAVEALGVGDREPPPAHVRDALLNRVIPLLDDPEADPWEKTRAIREMGSGGHLLGADVLIRVLEDGKASLRCEAAAALEAIAGVAAGEDVGRWWAWWDGLPVTAVPTHDTSVREARKPGLP